MLLSLILTYASLITIISSTRDNTQRVLDSFCIEKATDIYKSIKNGSKYMVSNYYTDDFMNKLSKEICLELLDNSDKIWYNINEDRSELLYKYSNPLAANLEDNTLTLQMSFELILPLSFAGINYTDIKIPLTVKSVYNVIG